MARLVFTAAHGFALLSASAAGTAPREIGAMEILMAQSHAGREETINSARSNAVLSATSWLHRVPTNLCCIAASNGARAGICKVCAHDVSYMLNRMFQTFAFLGASLTHCGRWLGKHNPGECLSAASQLTASAAGIPMSGTGMDLTCKGTMHYLGETFGEHGVDLAKVAAIARRRLDGGASADGPVLV